MGDTRWKPSVTVAAIVERDGRFLLVEEETPDGLRLNNPAGHLDPGESPQQAVVREALEETARAFMPERAGRRLPVALRSAPAPASDVTYLRFAFSGDVGEPMPGRALDARHRAHAVDDARRAARQPRAPPQPAGAALHRGLPAPAGATRSTLVCTDPTVYGAAQALSRAGGSHEIAHAQARVVVGLSGGVDSAVAAWLLKQQGHEVVGIFMKNWEDDDDDEYCSSRQDFLDAAAVADVIGIEIEHVNFAAEYKDRVFAEFLREYQAGRTPNPDVLCNAEIKFKAFLDHALRLGAETIATGHYARVREARAARFELLKGARRAARTRATSCTG